MANKLLTHEEFDTAIRLSFEQAMKEINETDRLKKLLHTDTPNRGDVVRIRKPAKYE